jgi:membrane-bound metal-dependent hydrolase YbcI (DUF457 family)
MMGRQHASSALLAGVGLAACVPSAPWPIRGLVVIVCGGAGLLPDLDTPAGTAARSLGLVTRWLARAVDAASLLIYHATRSPADVSDRRSGHRTATHTVPACLLAGATVGLLGLLHPVAGAVCCALLGGLLACGYRKAGGLLAVSTGLVAWWTLTSYSGWSWLVPLAVTLGCLVHVGGDWLTNSGVPLLWPIRSQGKRWRLVRSPAPFAAGDHVETGIVRPLLWVALAVAVSAVTGVLPVLLSAVVSSSS